MSENVNREFGNIQSSWEFFHKHNIPKNARILDIGCNLGTLINRLYLDGYKDVNGSEVSQEAIDIARKMYPKIASNFSLQHPDVLPYGDETFDVVTMFDVIEHIKNTQAFLSNEVYRVLKPGGQLIFQTPNIFVNIPWEIISSRSLTKWRTWHCSLQSLLSLRNLLQDSGFREVKVEKFNVYTEYNKKKISIRLGRPFIALIWLAQKMPLALFPNFWGSARKPLK